jgi:hypothetical protein
MTNCGTLAWQAAASVRCGIIRSACPAQDTLVPASPKPVQNSAFSLIYAIT